MKMMAKALGFLAALLTGSAVALGVWKSLLQANKKKLITDGKSKQRISIKVPADVWLEYVTPPASPSKAKSSTKEAPQKPVQVAAPKEEDMTWVAYVTPPQSPKRGPLRVSIQEPVKVPSPAAKSRGKAAATDVDSAWLEYVTPPASPKASPLANVATRGTPAASSSPRNGTPRKQWQAKKSPRSEVKTLAPITTSAASEDVEGMDIFSPRAVKPTVSPVAVKSAPRTPVKTVTIQSPKYKNNAARMPLLTPFGTLTKGSQVPLLGTSTGAIEADSTQMTDESETDSGASPSKLNPKGLQELLAQKARETKSRRHKNQQRKQRRKEKMHAMHAAGQQAVEQRAVQQE